MIAFDTLKSNSESAEGMLVFYRGSKKNKEEIDILVGSGIMEYLPINSVSKIKSKVNQLEKICFRSSSSEKCMLFKPHIYFEQYFEVTTDKFGDISIEGKGKKEVFYDISAIRFQQRKNNSTK